MTRGSRALAALLLAVACAAVAHDPRPPIRAALRDLHAAGFEFEADLAFRVDPYASCSGVTCADLAVIRERRTVLLAPDAVREPALLRAALLEIWERYRTPRPGSVPDLARGSLRVIEDGARVGVDAPTLRRAHHGYRQLWAALAPDERSGLVDPETLVVP